MPEFVLMLGLSLDDLSWSDCVLDCGLVDLMDGVCGAIGYLFMDAGACAKSVYQKYPKITRNEQPRDTKRTYCAHTGRHTHEQPSAMLRRQTPTKCLQLP